MDRRPVNLNFITIRFPITAWVSILHRLSGLFVFLLIPALLWLLQESLASEERYQAVIGLLKGQTIKYILWLFLAALLYHWVAGIRHMLMDLHIGESKIGGRIGAGLVMLIFILLLGWVGIRL